LGVLPLLCMQYEEMSKTRESLQLVIFFGLQTPPPGFDRSWVALTREDVDEWREKFPDDPDLDELIKVSASHRKFPKGTKPRFLKDTMRRFLEYLNEIEMRERTPSDVLYLG